MEDFEDILEKYEDYKRDPRPMNQEPRNMAQGGRTGFEDGMRVMEDKLITNYKTKFLKEVEAGKDPSKIQSFEDYKKTQTEVDMNPGKKKLDKAITDAKKLIKYISWFDKCYRKHNKKLKKKSPNFDHSLGGRA